MKAESNVKPEKFEIENIQNDRCDIVLYDNIQEVTENDTKRYLFDIYRLNICYYNNIKNEIESDFSKYLAIAKKKEYEALATEVRKKRDELLKETDKDMCIDRLNIKLPDNLSATNLLSGMKQFVEGFANVFNGKTAEYRQKLRDIPQQDEFPYNVIWPNKEDLN